MSEPISREEHRDSIDHVMDRIDKNTEAIMKMTIAVSDVKASSEAIMTMVKDTAAVVDAIGNEIYGTKSGVGLKPRHVALEARMSLMTWCLCSIMASILGVAFWIVKNNLT